MNWEQPKTYAVKHKDSGIRMASRSGGIFTALSDETIKNGGVVYGCVLTDDFRAVHIRAEKAEDRDRMRGSKYIQSNLGDIFISVRKDLDEGRRVLFSGTSCQVAGLKAFLGKEDTNLFCVDIVCYGVPSPLVWRSYLEWQEEKNGKCISVDFRNKKDFGWASHVETLTMENKSGKEKAVNSKVYATLFSLGSILRPSCYKCPYKSAKNPGDITIADYWGIDKAAPGFNDNKGTSLVIINNESGEKEFDRIKGDLEYRETDWENSQQPALIKPLERPRERDIFWKEFYNMPFDKLVKKYSGHGMKTKIKMLINHIKRGK